ncbi:all-trans retinoic acid-induced differentiation factor isoform X2 [Myotis lucifugus]|uniref:all-trans retinoic acid-induced differentiation factor isoform X2 n=1 Tax=Myotis lucifugus TaxID=59463 RepID=UPI000CCC60D7|nr:all-trans retinoic acid-induced differentiation factor isoform X2 [Myotis lucifugus]
MSPRGPGSAPIPLPLAAALLLALRVGRALALPEICIQCPGSVGNRSEVARYCKQTPELMLHARCCLNQNGTILGLDLQNCSLKHLGPNFPQAHTAIIIDLHANPLKDDLANTFHGFIQLQTLILPEDVNCPGGINAWNTVTFYPNNQTCEGQRNLCNSTGDTGLVLAAYVLWDFGIHHIVHLHPSLGNPTPKSQGFMNYLDLPTDLRSSRSILAQPGRFAS